MEHYLQHYNQSAPSGDAEAASASELDWLVAPARMKHIINIHILVHIAVVIIVVTNHLMSMVDSER